MASLSRISTAASLMLLTLLCAVLSVVTPTRATAQRSAASAATFDELFTGRTLRFDYHHSGTHDEEHIALHQLRLEGPWPGSKRHLVDTSNLGKYLFQVIDPSTHQVVYSAGFSSIYGEWETTGEARAGHWRTEHESQRFPEPRRPVQLVIKKRASDGTFTEIFSRLVDPASRAVDRSPLTQIGNVVALQDNGDPAEKVDLLILGDGYAAAEMPTYREHARTAAEAIFAFPPFAQYRERFNVWVIEVPSSASGISQPRTDTWRRTPLGLTYNAFDSERYMLTFDNESLREVAALAPYDALILLANDEQYGGGGIFGLYMTASARSAQLPYLVVHEFGHSFAGLADEYYTSQVAYQDFTAPGTEPWEPNITALLDPERVKWRDLTKPETPIPTPWNQEVYDQTSIDFQKQRSRLREAQVSEQRMDHYFAQVAEATAELLESEPHFGEVGAFEGGGYQAKGLYRPSVDCIMFTRNPKTYCPVCTRAIEQRILSLTQ